MVLYRNGEVRHGYYLNPRPRNIDDFRGTIADSFRESATFMNALLLTRMEGGHYTRIHNMNIFESYGESVIDYTLDTMEELIGEIEHRFGIPAHISEECLSGLQLKGDAWN